MCHYKVVSAEKCLKVKKKCFVCRLFRDGRVEKIKSATKAFIKVCVCACIPSPAA